MTDTIDPLEDEALFVRPPAERIPAGLAGTAAGNVFGELVRWYDGGEHAVRRRRVERFIATLDAAQIGRHAEVEAARATEPNEARFDVPLAVMADAIGVAPDRVHEAVTLARCAARGMGPGATGEPGEAIAAVPGLVELVPGDDALDTANRIGLLLQACDAVAGLVASALAEAADEMAGVDADRAVERALGSDPPVRSARRFRADGSLVTVDITGRPFGAGAHRCPGERLARALAAGTVAGLARRR